MWFDATAARSVFDHWQENLIIDEGPPPDAGTAGVPDIDPSAVDPTVTGPTADPTAQSLEEEGTFINALLIVDIDGDGQNDIVGTIDRGDLSGLADDALVWFENRRN